MSIFITMFLTWGRNGLFMMVLVVFIVCVGVIAISLTESQDWVDYVYDLDNVLLLKRNNEQCRMYISAIKSVRALNSAISYRVGIPDHLIQIEFSESGLFGNKVTFMVKPEKVKGFSLASQEHPIVNELMMRREAMCKETAKLSSK